MELNIKQLPYLPDFSKLINTMIGVVERSVSDIEQSEYLDFLLKVGIIEPVDGIYRYGNEWNSLNKADHDTIKNSIWEKLGKVDELIVIVRYIGAHGKTYDEIVNAFVNQYSEQTIRVVLSWMEYLDVLRIEKGCY